jgi:ribosomal protein S12 methylthiotransferase accessory factor
MITDVIFDVKLPQGFPEKYKEALVRSIELCSVKKHMMEPPKFHINTH